MPRRNNTADIKTTTTYEWADADHEWLKRINPDGSVTWGLTSQSREFVEFLEAGGEVAPYVEPEPPAPLTTEEKVNNMLAAYGLTREEMQAALAAK